MDDSILKTIEKIRARIKLRDLQSLCDKRVINSLCEIEGDPPEYPDLDMGTQEINSNTSVRPDQFFGRPVATVVKEILERRASLNLGAIPLAELFDKMKTGGFDFDNKDEKIAQRNLAITIGKNPAFIKVPNNGYIGLAEWYPTAKKDKKQQPGNGSEAGASPVDTAIAHPPVDGPQSGETHNEGGPSRGIKII